MAGRATILWCAAGVGVVESDEGDSAWFWNTLASWGTCGNCRSHGRGRAKQPLGPIEDLSQLPLSPLAARIGEAGADVGVAAAFATEKGATPVHGDEGGDVSPMMASTGMTGAAKAVSAKAGKGDGGTW